MDLIYDTRVLSNKSYNKILEYGEENNLLNKKIPTRFLRSIFLNWTFKIGLERVYLLIVILTVISFKQYGHNRYEKHKHYNQTYPN